MRYLFFDIECCDGRNICEFGYVITDADFTILEKNDILINPNARFNLSNRFGQSDIKLFYPEQTYFRSPKFPTFYEQIKHMIEFPDQIVIGHAISNDAGFLLTACDNYDLTPIDFTFADSQKMYMEFANARKRTSLEAAGETLNITPPKYQHKADEDAESTMRLVAKMCEDMELSLPEFIELCPTCTGKCIDRKTSYDVAPVSVGRQVGEDGLPKPIGYEEENSMGGDNYVFFLQFLDGVKPKGKIIESRITGKSICLSMNYEFIHYKEMLSIVQLIVNHGATYRLKASLSDIFVKCKVMLEDGNEKPCTRSMYVEDAIEHGATIEIITFEELLEILGTSEAQIKEMPFPDIDSFKRKDGSHYVIGNEGKRQKPKKSRDYITKSKPNTLGDMLKAQGIDLSAMFPNDDED